MKNVSSIIITTTHFTYHHKIHIDIMCLFLDKSGMSNPDCINLNHYLKKDKFIVMVTTHNIYMKSRFLNGQVKV